MLQGTHGDMVYVLVEIYVVGMLQGTRGKGDHFWVNTEPCIINDSSVEQAFIARIIRRPASKMACAL